MVHLIEFKSKFSTDSVLASSSSVGSYILCNQVTTSIQAFLETLPFRFRFSISFFCKSESMINLTSWNITYILAFSDSPGEFHYYKPFRILVEGSVI